MNWPPVASYRSVVPPVVVTSISSITVDVPQTICFCVKVSTADVPTSSVAPANTSNFSGTVEPPLTEFQTVAPMSTGWWKPARRHAATVYERVAPAGLVPSVAVAVRVCVPTAVL